MPLKSLAAAFAALGLMLAGGVLFAPAPARADIEVDVNEGVVSPLPVAVPAFGGGQQGGDIARVIAANLDRSGLFKIVDPATYTERNLDVSTQPNFGGWRQIGAQALINGQVTTDPDGRLRVDFRLWDLGSQQQLLGLQFTGTPDNWRRVAHKISDAVYERLTGEKGYFDSRVVFVAESGERTNRIKRLAIMDQDGANPSYLPDGGALVMSPQYSPNRQEITYIALRPSGSYLMIFNIETGRSETLGKFDGIIFSPRFSPDGTQVAFSVDRGGNADIYIVNLRTRALRRITSDPAIDTSPSFSADGTKLVFNSDRGGSPQLYTMNVDGSGVRRLSFGGGRYTVPTWSPKGDYIAFTKQGGGRFSIGVMRADGSGERILAGGYMDEGPTWAPNGRVLMFGRESGAGAGKRLWMVDVTGRVLRPVPYTGGASDPAWSPLLD